MNDETITIRNGWGTPKYEATVAFRVGQFVVINEEGSKRVWNVTHVPTGLACCKMIRSKVKAIAFAKWIKERFDAHGIDANRADQDVLKAHKKWGALSTEVYTRRNEITEYYKGEALGNRLEQGE